MAVSNRDCQENCPTGDITYDIVQVDNSGSFDKNDGTFVAPIGGTYMFLFNAFVHSDNARIGVIVNGVASQDFREYASDQNQLVAFWSLDLVQGDEVKMENYVSSSVYISNNHLLYFMGILIN